MGTTTMDPAEGAASTPPGGLNVIALVSGGKDSFFSLLHCRANGHRIVALANLHPPAQQQQQRPGEGAPARELGLGTRLAAGLETRQDAGLLETAHPPAHPPAGGAPGNDVADEDERDLNSFMYQTVGHQMIPLYAEATGLPLFRRPITGAVAQHGKDYSHYAPPSPPASGTTDVEIPAPAPAPGPDETESMVPLLQAVMKAHPEANALCAGAILSTYQRTRVESVAVRLGLTPLAYLWNFPVLPTPGPGDGSDAQLLDDMAAAGVEARIVKVASGGLDESFLWTDVAAPGSKARLARAMGRFGPAERGAVIGEGGEFETLVLDGPRGLFKKRIVVDEADRRVVAEGGGSAWLSVRKARLEEKDATAADGTIRIPDLLDAKFTSLLSTTPSFPPSSSSSSPPRQLGTLLPALTTPLLTLTFPSSLPPGTTPIQTQTNHLLTTIRSHLHSLSLSPTSILSTTILLRHMSDFATINPLYATLFPFPNPPSRVTISCGEDAQADITIAMTVHPGLQGGERQALHVQSRSYWAPANIGPYSQAVAFPFTSRGGAEERARLVSVAGQIPLVPASMELLSCAGGMDGQVVLGLQHLWRIGAERGVAWWTSCVAYFAGDGAAGGSSSSSSIERRVELAARAWRAAHNASPSGEEDQEDDDDDEGPDVWDRRYNDRFRSYAAAPSGRDEKGLPDRSVLTPSSAAVPAPPLFVAEVAELPRAAGVEWHAHLGIAHAGEGSVALRTVEREGGVVVAQVVVAAAAAGAAAASFVQTVVAEPLAAGGGGQGGEGHGRIAAAALAELGEVGDAGGAEGEPAAAVRYVDAGVLRQSQGQAKGEGVGGGLVVPCRSLWDDEGRRLAAVTVYQSVFERRG